MAALDSELIHFTEGVRNDHSREWPWEILRDKHFEAHSEQASMQKLDAWARENGVAIHWRQDEARSGQQIPTRVVELVAAPAKAD
jgi:hypothetical protein